MGIHDYSCFLCSFEGEQNLINWKECTTDTDEYEEIDYKNMQCTYPPQIDTINGFGENKAYIFFFKKNPLEHRARSYKHKKASYSCIYWNFKRYAGYKDILIKEQTIYSVWNHFGRWLVNICPSCYYYFIKDKLNDPPPMLLTRVIKKFKLTPFHEFGFPEFPIYSLKNNNDMDQFLMKIFPLSCVLLRDYIRAFCGYLGLREMDIDFQFENIVDKTK